MDQTKTIIERKTDKILLGRKMNNSAASEVQPENFDKLLSENSVLMAERSQIEERITDLNDKVEELEIQLERRESDSLSQKEEIKRLTQQSSMFN
jgi:predicted nuclease with TOPRIM domain